VFGEVDGAGRDVAQQVDVTASVPLCDCGRRLREPPPLQLEVALLRENQHLKSSSINNEFKVLPCCLKILTFFN
jgi:hypothetical protein